MKINSLPLLCRPRSPLAASEMPSAIQPLSRHAHAFVEDVSDDDVSSPDTTPSGSRRNSFFENVMSEEQLMAYAAGIPLPSDLDAPTETMSIGRRMHAFMVPKNFAQVVPNLYRCSYPQVENLAFLRCLRLKSILTLVEEPYDDAHCQFITQGSIHHFEISIKAHKKKGDRIDESHLLAALKEVCNPGNHPMLVHCNKGKHRTGCVMACFRKMLGWRLEDVIAEYLKYAGVKARQLDIEYITSIDAEDLRQKLAFQIKSPRLPAEPFTASPVSAAPINSTRLRG